MQCALTGLCQTGNGTLELGKGPDGTNNVLYYY